jgi:hypothetical protein
VLVAVPIVFRSSIWSGTFVKDRERRLFFHNLQL